MTSTRRPASSLSKGHHFVTIVLTDQRLACTCTDRKHSEIVDIAGPVR